MTKPREKNREELQAEIEDGKKKIRQFENREKMLRQKLSKEERRTRSHRLIVRGAVFESIVPETKNMTDEEAAALLRLREAANMLGIHDCDLYAVWKNENLEYVVVDFVRRIPAEVFERWYADQSVYHKVNHIPTAEELDEEYICLQDAADILGLSREKLAKIAKKEEIGELLDSTVCNNKRWITRKSFELFLNAQDRYQIVRDEDRSGEDQATVEIKEYISRQDAAKLAGVTESTITKWMQIGKFTCTGAGKVLRIHRTEFIEWLDEYREGAK